jgi:polyhydroxyalkanoate synthase
MNDKLEKLFTNINELNQNWFNNLLTNKDQNTFNLQIYLVKSFFDKSKQYLELQHNFYNQQILILAKIFKVKNININLLDNNYDKRFSEEEWVKNPFFCYLKNLYFGFSNYLNNLVKNIKVNDESKAKIIFFMEQYLNSISPTNFFFTNPQAIKEIINTNGQSFIQGVNNFITDLKNGYIKMTDESNFAVGKNLAITDGNIVFKNELIELIHYKPTTKKIYKIPLLIVPPFINKYYILDLQKKDSFVKFLIDSGYNVYLISWKSADDTIINYTWDNYVENGVISALDFIRSCNKNLKINTLGYCIGGTLLSTAYLVLKYRSKEYINSITKLTSMLDFSNSGDIKYFINDILIKHGESKNDFFASGKLIGYTFSLLRAKDLIWNYWVNNYLLGKTPESFDILYWNNDTIDLPIKLHNYLLKNLYTNNELIASNAEICGVKINLKNIDCPLYLFATQKDHIVPWISAYKTIFLVGSKIIRFVLGESGHTAGVINPASNNKKGYWINDNKSKLNSENWLQSAKNISGSWWHDYNNWLKNYSGDLKNVTKNQLNDLNKLYKAPGEYVLNKSRDIFELFN